ncbi:MULTISPECIES: hypothetical protein [Bacteroides]|uniref:hypothetical protein n=1 Tax=Bacteroides TaxID=816 RepID=UPI0013141F85|nr:MULTISPECIES: hypothetical protein [Bacteroides]MBS7575576.1 hypothetical protein [Bacteroides propionicigenes]
MNRIHGATERCSHCNRGMLPIRLNDTPTITETGGTSTVQSVSNLQHPYTITNK